MHQQEFIDLQNFNLVSTEFESSSLDSYLEDWENFGDRISVKAVPPLIIEIFDGANVDW